VNVTVRQDLWNENYDLPLPFPDHWDVEVLHMAGHGRKRLDAADYRRALAPLRPMVASAREICVLFDDLSRPTRASEILPFLYEVFEGAGIRDEQVRFICALGTHAPHDNAAFRKKLGDEALERFPVYNHNPYEHCTHLGTTTLGTPVMVNKEYLACDLRLAIGSFIPHSFCGFGGGYKVILPAVSHIDAITHHHGTLLKQYWDAAYAIGKCDGNPLLGDLKEYGRMVGLNAKIDVLVDETAGHVGIFAGDPDALYEHFTDRALTHYATTAKAPADVVFVNAYGKANEAVIALALGELFLKEEGGHIVVLCDIPGGQVVHYLLGRFGKDSWGRLAFGPRMNAERVRKIFVYSRRKDRANEWWFGGDGDVCWSANLEEIVKAIDGEYGGRRIRVHVIPDGTVQMPPRRRSCK
jgi:nickel-dependent lactate racemase